MKDKNIIKSFKAIKPSSIEKNMMLENILSGKKKTTPFKNLVVPALSFALVIMFNVNTNDIENITPNMASFRMNYEKVEFTYNSKCYEETNLEKGNHLRQIGITSKIENSDYINIPIYKDENNTTILNMGNYYLTFKEIDCFKNMKG